MILFVFFRMWSGFVDCVRRYMSRCSSEGQRLRFNRAVAHSMDTVHQICSSDNHQKGESVSFWVRTLAPILDENHKGNSFFLPPVRSQTYSRGNPVEIRTLKRRDVIRKGELEWRYSTSHSIYCCRTTISQVF